MRLTTEVFHSVQTRRRRGSSSVTPVTDDRFFMDFYSTANNKFYPLYIIHDLYARTKKEIIYRATSS